MKKLAIIGIAIIALTLSGCSSNWRWFGWFYDDELGSSTEVTAAITAAEAAIKKADSIGGSWRDSKKKYLKKAKAAAAKGENKEALKFANKAKFEGEMAHKQALEQANAGPWLF